MKRAWLLVLSACGGGSADTSFVMVPTQPLASAAPAPLASAPPSAPVAAPVAFRCDAKRFEVSGRSYCAYENGEPWDKAEERCVANGGHLMTFDARAKSDAIHRALGSPVGAGRAAWIGLELKTKHKSDWKWNGKDAVTESNWNEGEPNDWDQNEMCGEWLVADGTWNDTRCDLKQPYLCEGSKLDCKGGKPFEAGGVSYCLNATNRSHADAKAACARDGGTLAVFKDRTTGAKVRDAAAQKFAAKKMWIGLTDAAAEGEWRWASGERASFAAWQSGEPNDFNTENCVELWADTWTWNDFDCNATRPFVCEASRK